MKTKNLVFTIALGLICASSFAQNPKEKKDINPEEKAKKQTEWMSKELNLNDKQKKQVNAINLKYAQEAQNQQIEKKAFKEKMKEKKTERVNNKENDLKSVLSADQFKLFKQKQDEKKAKHELKCRRNAPRHNVQTDSIDK